ncbi:adenosine deaminase [Acetobacteraceae bacterium]|nr:adenosine deaminase [Acetobacteraceae bacterium]
MRLFYQKTFRFFISSFPLLGFSVLSPIVGQARPTIEKAIEADLGTDSGMEAVLKENATTPAALSLFLQDFPKGADLHNHLIGAVYAESFLNWAEADGNCVHLKTNELSAETCKNPLSKEEKSAIYLMNFPKKREALIDVMSMRHFVAHPHGETGHDHFFNAFHHIGVKTYRTGDMIAEARTRAARDHIQYLELMISPDLSGAMAQGQKLSEVKEVSAERVFRQWHKEISPFLPLRLERAVQEIDQAQARSDALLGCHKRSPREGCKVNARYLYQVIRTAPPKEVFSQLAIGYALTSKDPRFVGINFVAPEDAPIALKDYTLHMQMFHFFHHLYPHVHLALHAGELTSELVGKDALKDHIRQAVEIAGAERIGHGVDIAYEEKSQQLLKEMAKKKILVEINLTSNDEILGIKGKQHPLSLYQKAGVPVSLSTDDEGISRGDLTQEYVRAVFEQGASYQDLKNFSQTGLEYAFLEGKSLWKAQVGGIFVSACKKAQIKRHLTDKCQKYLEKNEKAAQEWELEKRFQTFENLYLLKTEKVK